MRPVTISYNVKEDMVWFSLINNDSPKTAQIII